MQSTKTEALPIDCSAPVLDRTALMERMDGDTELLAELAAIFLEDCPRLMAAAREAVADRNEEAVVTAAHAIKGAVSNFCARGCVEAAYALERLGREGIPREGAAEAWAQAEAVLLAVEAEIERLVPVLTVLATAEGPSGGTGSLSETERAGGEVGDECGS